MKAVLISIHPEWCELILSGKKTLEVRKTRPKLETPFKVYIYCTSGNLSYPVGSGMICHNNGCRIVMGEFVCNDIRCFDVPYPAFQSQMDKSILEQSCLTYYQLHRYAYHDRLYAWHISNLKVYDKPRSIAEFTKPYGTIVRAFDSPRIQRPPQSWRYVEAMP